MRKDLLVLLCIPLILCSASGCTENSEGTEGFTREEALEFGLNVVRTYFTNDIEGFISYLDDEVFILEGDGPYSRSYVEEFIRDEGFVASEQYTEYTFQDYTDTYAPYVLDYEEANDMFDGMADAMIAIGWDFDSDDYIFMGFETRSGNEDDQFLWDDPLIFAITHEDGYWSFKAFSS